MNANSEIVPRMLQCRSSNCHCAMTSNRTRCRSRYKENSGLSAFERHLIENASTRQISLASSARPERGRDGTHCRGTRNTDEVLGARRQCNRE